MGKKKHLLTPSVQSPSSSQESPKKKKKKRRKSDSQEEEELAPIIFHPIPILDREESPKKKKKKRKSESQEDELTPPLSLPIPTSDGSGSPKKRRKRGKSSDSQEEEGGLPSSLCSSSSSQSKRRRKKEEDPAINGAIEVEEEVIEGKKKKKKTKEAIEIKEEKPSDKKEKEAETEKKKRKTKTLDAQTEEERKRETGINEEMEIRDAQSSLKKKKKKEAKTLPPPTTTTTTSTTTKTEVGEDENVEVEEEEEDWSTADTQELLHRITQQLPAPHRDFRICRHTLKNLDWKTVAIPGRPSDDCKEHFMSLYKKINPYKNLTTVVNEIRDLVASGIKHRRYKPLIPIQIFFKHYFTPERKEEAKSRGEKLLQLGNQAWKKLPQEEKMKYQKMYNEEKNRIQRRLNTKESHLAKKLPKQPYQLCWLAQGATKGTNIHSRTYYASLSKEEQVPYIRQALENVINFENKHDAHPDEQQQQSIPTIFKADLQTYLESYGCPPMPPLRPLMLFYKEVVDKGTLKGVTNKRKMVVAAKKYKELSKTDKNTYKNKVEEGLRKYEEALKVWEQNQDEVTLYAFKKYKEAVPYFKSQTKKAVRHVKLDDVFPYTEPSYISCPKFNSEPHRPPATPYRLFAIKFRTSMKGKLSGSEMQQAMSENWKSMDEEEHGVYITRCRTLRMEYEMEIRQYVNDMEFKTRRLYLGFHRLSLYRYFNNRDVFAEDFPNSKEYPILVKEVLPTKASPTKFQEEDEEEEIEAHDWKSDANDRYKTKAATSFDSEDDSDDEDEENLTVDQSKKSARSDGSKAAATSDSEDDSDDEDEANLTLGPVKKQNTSKSEEDSEEESEDEMELEVNPAWMAQPSPSLSKNKQDPYDSSSSGFLDSDSD